MKDFNRQLLSELYDLLSFVDNTYSILSDDLEYPFIYIGNIQTTMTPCKSGFKYNGTFDIKYYSSFNIISSLTDHYDIINDIKGSLLNTKTDILDLGNEFRNSILYLQSDIDYEDVRLDSRVFITQLTYYFEIEEI